MAGPLAVLTGRQADHPLENSMHRLDVIEPERRQSPPTTDSSSQHFLNVLHLHAN